MPGCISVKFKMSLITGAAFALAGALPAISQEISQSEQMWSAEVIKKSGQPVIPLFDGWYTNSDGSHTLCFGYFNMNTEESIDIPLGEKNHLKDERFEAMLPTHFDPVPERYRHKYCSFTVTVPEDFGRDDDIVWSLTSAGETITVPGRLNPAYVMDEISSDGRGSLAPWVKLEADGERARGRNGIFTKQPITTRTGKPTAIRAWIEHPEDQVWVGWSKHSGPGDVTFDKRESQIEGAGRAEYDMETNEPALVNATFAEPGDYVLQMQTIDSNSHFEFYCCHTNAYFHVNVTD